MMIGLSTRQRETQPPCLHRSETSLLQPLQPHPFWLKTIRGPGAVNGILAVSSQGAQTGDVVWTPMAADIGTTFYYNCEYHSVMNGTIMVVASGSVPAQSCAPFTLMPGSTLEVTNIGVTAYNIGSCNSNPSLVVTAGSTYMFNVLSTGHPFWIKTVQGPGQTNGATGVTNNGVQSGTVTFTPTCAMAGSTLHYNCEFHPSMTGTITVLFGSCPGGPQTPGTPQTPTIDTAASTLSSTAFFVLAVVGTLGLFL